MKSSMSSQKISFYYRLLSSVNIFKSYKKGYLGSVENALKDHFEIINAFKKYSDSDIKTSKILDVGNGQTATQVVLFQADGAEVIGIDMELPTYKMGSKLFLKVAKINGFERAIKSLFRHLLFDKNFFKELKEKYHKNFDLNKLDCRLMNAAKMEFADNTFDFIYSTWVFEHIDNVSESLKEINRVLKPNGLAWIGVHLFLSLSGGHNLEWIDPENNPSNKVPAWDHLLENEFPVNTFLNKLTLDQYREIFKKNIEIIDEKLTVEGKNLLSEEIENKLKKKGFNQDDLFTRTVVFICRKK